jgi:hypothetical protein
MYVWMQSKCATILVGERGHGHAVHERPDPWVLSFSSPAVLQQLSCLYREWKMPLVWVPAGKCNRLATDDNMLLLKKVIVYFSRELTTVQASQDEPNSMSVTAALLRDARQRSISYQWKLANSNILQVQQIFHSLTNFVSSIESTSNISVYLVLGRWVDNQFNNNLLQKNRLSFE